MAVTETERAQMGQEGGRGGVSMDEEITIKRAGWFNSGEGSGNA